MNQEEPNTNTGTGDEKKSEEAKSETLQEPVPEPVKLSDKPSDFRFHAAYLTYSDAWDKASTAETKLKLNESLEALSTEKIDYETFYREISQYRVQSGAEHFGGGGRAFIETQRKKDWRRREEREGRNKRHGR